MPSSNDPRLLQKPYHPSEMMARVRSIPDRNNDPATEIDAWIKNLHDQNEEMSTGEESYLNELRQRTKT
jgi:DNA-binding response OmpR family regulator